MKIPEIVSLKRWRTFVSALTVFVLISLVCGREPEFDCEVFRADAFFDIFCLDIFMWCSRRRHARDVLQAQRSLLAVSTWSKCHEVARCKFWMIRFGCMECMEYMRYMDGVWCFFLAFEQPFFDRPRRHQWHCGFCVHGNCKVLRKKPPKFFGIRFVEFFYEKELTKTTRDWGGSHVAHLAWYKSEFCSVCFVQNLWRS